MNPLMTVRGNNPEVARVMRELRFDEPTAQRHVEQLKVLRYRLAGQRRADLARAMESLLKVSP